MNENKPNTIKTQVSLLGRATKTLLIAGMSITAANAATSTLSWNGNPNSLNGAFQTAINAAGNGGTVIVPPGTYRSNSQILVEKRVTIKGDNRNNTKIFANANGNRLFMVAADGVTFLNMEINGNNQVQNAINNFRKKGMHIRNSRIQNAKRYNVGNANNYPNSGLYMRGTIIKNGIFGVGVLNRETNVTEVRNLDRVELDNLTIEGFSFTAVEIDCANDLGGYLTNFNWTKIHNNFMNSGGDFCVGGTQCKRITIENNNLTCAHDPVHFEFKSREVTIRRNTLRSTNTNGGFAGVALIPGDRILGPSNGNTPVNGGFRNPTPNNHIHGCRAINVLGNTINGTAKWGVLSVEAADCRVEWNTFNLNVTNGQGAKILLTDKAGSISGFGGSQMSQGSKRFTIANNFNLVRNDIQFANNVGHVINE